MQEGRSITVEFEKFILVAAYVPNSGEMLNRLSYRVTEWDADFRAYLKSLRTAHNKPLILTGDLNVVSQKIDHYNFDFCQGVPGSTPQERHSFH